MKRAFNTRWNLVNNMASIRAILSRPPFLEYNCFLCRGKHHVPSPTNSGVLQLILKFLSSIELVNCVQEFLS
jgi:hypothetical protein